MKLQLVSDNSTIIQPESLEFKEIMMEQFAEKQIAQEGYQPHSQVYDKQTEGGIRGHGLLFEGMTAIEINSVQNVINQAFDMDLGSFQEQLQKSDALVDLPPIEPLPPIDVLEMTQNHKDWVRGVQNYRSQKEQMDELRKCTLQNLEMLSELHKTQHPRTTSGEWDPASAGDQREFDREMQILRLSDFGQKPDQKQNLQESSATDFIMEEDLQQLFELEQQLAQLIQQSGFANLKVPKVTPPPDLDDSFDNQEPISQSLLGGSLKNLENFLIRGDLRHCILCNSEFTDSDSGTAVNLPRVLYCGDCLCENCIVRQIQKVSLQDRQQNVASCQITCPVCCVKHIFKLTRSGYLICNDKYIKFQDEKGPVNLFSGNKTAPSFGTEVQMMDQSVHIDNSLVLRSLPVNLEILDLIRSTKQSRPFQEEQETKSEPQGWVKSHIISQKNSEPSVIDKHREALRKKTPVLSETRRISNQFKPSQKKRSGRPQHTAASATSTEVQQTVIQEHQLPTEGDDEDFVSVDEDEEEGSDSEQQKQLLESLEQFNQKTGHNLKLRDISVTEENGVTTLNFSSKITKEQTKRLKKLKRKKKKSQKIIQPLSNLVKGVQLTQDDIFTRHVPDVISDTQVFFTDQFEMPEFQPPFQEKFPILQTMVWKENHVGGGPPIMDQAQVPLTCFICSGQAPLYTAKNHRKPEFGIDSDEPARPEVYSKQQHLVIKELVEVGVQSVCTHYCLNCFENAQVLWRKIQFNNDEDQAFMCLGCSLEHKRAHPDHYLQNLFSPICLSMVLKKEGWFKDNCLAQLQALIERKASEEIDSFQAEVLEAVSRVEKASQQQGAKKKRKK